MKTDKIDHEKTPAGVKIGKTLYKKKVNPPDPTELLNMEMEELDRILAIEVIKGPVSKVADSVFIPYSADVGNFQTIRDIYMKIRLMHARARHIVCAFYLPGAEKHYNQDYVDDDEIGAG